MFFCFFALFFYFTTFALPSWEQPTAFLEHDKKQKQFERGRKNILQKRVKGLGKLRSHGQLDPEPKGFLEHTKRQKQYEAKRKGAFATYKKQYEQNKQKQENLRLIRWEQLRLVRKKEQALKKQKDELELKNMGL